MKSYDYDAVILDGDVYCVDCLPDDVPPEDITPIFADSEWDYYPSCDKCGSLHEYVSLTNEGQRYEQERAGPQEEDITISPCGPLGSLYAVGVVNGEFIGRYPDWDSVVVAIKGYMEENNFSPTVWGVSDHGNASIVTL
jgi:hypothetical protein